MVYESQEGNIEHLLTDIASSIAELNERLVEIQDLLVTSNKKLHNIEYSTDRVK